MSARGINRNPQFQFDVLSARPSASLCRVGQRFYALDTQQEFVVTPVSGGGRFWFQTNGGGAADVTLFVNSATGSDNNPGTAALPFATLAKAQAVAPYLTAGKARINLIGAGPYTLAPQTHGSVPVGPSGQPLVIVGDAYTQVITGTVTAGGGTGTITTNIAGAAEAYRGMIFHNTTSGKTDQYFLLKDSAVGPNVVLQSVTGAFGTLANTDTFEILQCATTITVGGAKFTSGTLGFWRCKLDFGAFVSTNQATFDGGIVCCFDGCEWTGTTGRVYVQDARVYGLPFSQLTLLQGQQAFNNIADIGTPPSGVTNLSVESNAGLWFHNGSSGFFLLNGRTAFFSACLVTDVSLVAGDGEMRFDSGYDCLSSATSFTAISVAGGMRLALTGIAGNNFRLGGASCVGVAVAQGGNYVDITSAVFTGCGTAALSVDTPNEVRLAAVSGSTGNGVGALLTRGGLVWKDSGVSVTGSAGDVQIDGQTATTWTIALGTRSVVASSDGQSGTAYCWAALITGAAGAATFFAAQGGLPTAAFASATAVRVPVTPGRIAQLFRLTSLANAATSATAFTIFRAPLATGIPASTTLTLSVGATTTGSFSDVSHSVAFNAGDQIDLQGSNSAAGVGNNLAFSASVQAA